MVEKNYFSKRLKELRSEAGYSQGDLAAKIDMSRSAVANWEHARCEPGVEELKKLAQAFSMSVDTLVGAPNALNEEERELVRKFRSLNEEGRTFILMALNTATASDLYKKCDIVSAV